VMAKVRQHKEGQNGGKKRTPFLFSRRHVVNGSILSLEKNKAQPLKGLRRTHVSKFISFD
jgi:hypothetical protein